MAIWERYKGETFDGRYSFLSFLGEGSWGEVVCALDSVRSQEVAVKLLKERPGHDMLADRFFRSEFRAMASIEHPNIVRVFDFGQSSDGVRYYAMELVPGEVLSEHAGNLKGRRLADVFKGLCSALEAVHVRGSLHCDVKPDNIKVIAEGTKLKPILMDFGLHAEFHSESGVSPRGTPIYAAPEMLAGQPTDARADIYSLGMTMLEAITGELPYKGRNLGAVLSAEASTGLVAESLGKVPKMYRELIGRMIAPDPRDRFPSCNAILRELAARGEADTAMPPPAAPRHLLHPDLIGRENQQKTIHQSTDGLLSGKGGCVLIEGSGGSGKSRLLQEAKYHAQVSGAGVISTADRTSMPNRASLRSLLEEAVDFSDTDPEGADRREMLLHGVSEQSRKRPLLIVVDDVHELTPDDAGLWRALAFRALNEGYLVISSVAARRYAKDSHVAVLLDTVGDDLGFAHLKLENFDLDQVAKLCRSMLGTTEDVSSLAELIMTRTGGNVGASVELLDKLAREDGLKHKVGSWSVRPKGLGESNRRARTEPRLELRELQGALRDTLLSVAINGPTALASMVQRIAGLTRDEFAQCILQCEEMGILAWETVGRKAYVRFEDADLPKSILRTADPKRVAHLSARAADELLARRSENKPFDPVRLMEHLSTAGRLEEALEFAASEGEPRRRLGEHWVAIRLLKPAIGIAENSPAPDWAKIAELESSLVRAHWFHGDNQTALRICAEGCARLERAGLDESTTALLSAPLLSVAGNIHEDLGEYDVAIEYQTRALSMVAPFSQKPQHYPLWLFLRDEVNWAKMLNGNLTESEEATRALLAELDPDMFPDQAIMTHATAGWVSIYQGKPEEGLGQFLEAHAISVRNGLIENSKFLPARGAAAASRHLGRWKDALTYAEEEYRIAEITRYPPNMIDALVSVAEAEIELGMLRSAESHLRKNISLVSEAGVIVSYIGALSGLGRVLTLQGKNDEARRVLEKARKIALKKRYARLTVQVEGQLGELLLNEDKTKRAEPLLMRALQKARKQNNSDLLPEANLRMARVALAQGSSRRFNYYAGKCAEYAEASEMKQIINQLEREKAQYWVYRDMPEKAHESFRKAAASFAESGAAFEEALTRLQWAELCLKEGRLDKVAELIDGLEVAFDEAGAAGRLNRVKELRAKIAQQKTSTDKVRSVVKAFAELRSAESIESALQSVAETMVSITGADRGIIAGFNQRGMIQFEASANFADTPQQHLQLSSSILSHVRQTRQPLLLESAATDVRFLGSSSIRNFQLGSVICVPIFLGGDLRGVLYVDSKESNLFDEQEHLPLAELIADHIGLFLDNARIQSENELVEELVSCLAHEMRSPLTTIEYCLDGIANPSGESRSRDVEIADHQVKRLSRLADETIDLIKHKSASRMLSMERIDVNALIKHVAESLQLHTQSKDISLELDLREELPQIEGQGDALEQVILNLGANAAKYTRSGGTICVRTDLTPHVQDPSVSASSILCMGLDDRGWRGSFVTVSVADDGEGMEEAECRRIFEKYARARQPDGEGRAKGFGLGLYICRNIVEQHGGRIWATSQKGKGTEVAFTLPVA